jgi:hypothetical protein
MDRISCKDISVVVQGAIVPMWTGECLESVRRHLPKAELILSTWEGEDVSGLQYDILLQNKDPGAEVLNTSGMLQNQNRQIVSARGGVLASSRSFVLKIRSDMQIYGKRFLSFFGRFSKRHQDFRIFNERILINSLYTRDPFGLTKYLFHPSDWISFGNREDVLNLWDIPIAPEPETSNYFPLHPHLLPLDPNLFTRWVPEQYIWLACLRKNGIEPVVDNLADWSAEFAEQSEIGIINNFVVLDYRKQMDIVCKKYTSRKGDGLAADHAYWLKKYKKYCDPNYKIAIKYDWNDLDERLGISFEWLKLKKHLRYMITPLRQIRIYGENILSVIYYMMRIMAKLVSVALKRLEK